MHYWKNIPQRQQSIAILFHRECQLVIDNNVNGLKAFIESERFLFYQVLVFRVNDESQ